MRFLLILLAGFYVAGIPHIAKAQLEFDLSGGADDEEDKEEKPPVNQFDPKYKPNVPKKDDGTTFSPVSGFSVNFIRDPNAGVDEATLRISKPVSVNGCADITMEPPKVTQNGNSMSISVADPKMKLSKKPRYSQHDCRIGIAAASVDVRINRADLLEKHINQIAFKSNGGLDYYTVDATQTRLTLLPKSHALFKPNETVMMADPLTYWFYPPNTIVLFAPRAPADADVTAEISKLAHAKGMAGLDETISGFEQPPSKKAMLYFVDQSGATAKALETSDTVNLGAIGVPETYHGAQGSYEKERPIDVLARKPGTLE